MSDPKMSQIKWPVRGIFVGTVTDDSWYVAQGLDPYLQRLINAFNEAIDRHIGV